LAAEVPAPVRQPFPTVESVLAVCAHPDDESFGLGAALSHLASRGVRVTVLCFTRGEASTLHQSPEELAAVRAFELETAAAELHVAEVVLFDHPDGLLSHVPLGELAAEVSYVAARVAPDVLLVFDEGGVTGHPDHRRATESALAGTPELPVLAWAVPRSVADALNAEFGTNFVGRDDQEIDLVLEVDREAQRRAIAAHVSQCTDNPVLWRRLELLADHEDFRWLQPPKRSNSDASADSSQSVSAEWDARYQAQPQLFREEPDETLVELVSPLPPGTAVDLGAGEGRNSLWLARQGWDVAAVDASTVALDRLRGSAAAQGVTIETVADDVFDYLRSAPDRGQAFDLVVIAFVHPPADERIRLLRAAAELVARGGHLFVVAHHLDSLGRSGPPDPQRLYTESDLRSATPDLELLRLERRNGASDVSDPGVDVFLWARRPGLAEPENVA
jgi:N-acetylglucosamine malate deacetylase 2